MRNKIRTIKQIQSKIYLMRGNQTMRKTHMTKKRVRRARRKKTKMRKTKTVLCNRIVTSKLKKTMLRNPVGIFRTQSLFNN